MSPLKQFEISLQNLLAKIRKIIVKILPQFFLYVFSMNLGEGF